MQHLYVTKRLFNLSRLEPTDLTGPSNFGQQTQDWYVNMTSSGFAGYFFMLYVHQPSLLSVIVKGNSISATYPGFLKRLDNLVQRFGFPKKLLAAELGHGNGYHLSGIKSPSMVAHINRLADHVSYWCGKVGSYENADANELEDSIMAYPYKRGNRIYKSPVTFWEEKLGIKSRQG